MQSNASLAVNEMASALKTTAPVVQLQSYEPAGKGLARVVLNVVHTAESQAKEGAALFRAAVRNAMQGKMQAVANSFASLDKGPQTEIVTGIVSVVRESKAIGSDADLKGFSAFASNMFLDNENEMWELRTTAAGRLLVRSTGIEDDDSMLRVLQSCSSAGNFAGSQVSRFQSLSSAGGKSVSGGNYASFINSNEVLAHGFVLATTDDNRALMLSESAEAPEMVNLNAITEVHDLGPNAPTVELTPEEQVNISMSAARGEVSVDAMVAYYRKIYSSNPVFFAEWEKRIRGHAFA